MSRTIPISLQSHLDSGTTTICGLIRITPVRPGYGVVGLTTLDRDVVYDDGDGPVTYYAAVGYTASNYVGTADFTVDNAETQSLFPEFDIPQLTEADINAGAYDYAEYKMMLVNYEDLAQGHILYSTGTMGEMKVVDGLSFMGELRSLFQRYRQSIVERDSLTCRATFGSQAADSPLASSATKIERFPCGFNAGTLWFNASVSAVGVEDNISFHATGLTQGDNFFVPGIVEWLTGANAGRQYEVAFYSGGVVSLAFPTAFPIAENDSFNIRQDCTKRWSGPNSCLTYNNRLNFRGEPFIPVGDAGNTSNPGASTNPGLTPGEQGTTSPGTTDPTPGVESLTGGLLDGYVNAPYVINTFANEGIVFSVPEQNNYWSIVGSASMPENVCAAAQPIVGFPTSAGASSYTIRAAQWGRTPLSVSGTCTILASPSSTVWNMADRYLANNTVIFLPGTAPMLSLQAQPLGGLTSGFGGRVRALNGYTTGKRYWEVTVDSLPAGTTRFALSVGVDRSVGDSTNAFWIGSDNNAGEWGYVIRRETDGGALYSAVARRGAVDIAAPAVVAGDVLRFVHDAGTNSLWVGINGSWIGGGNPDTNTSPTVSGISPPAGSYWPDYRPVAILGGGADVRITANFGDQTWAFSLPTGATTIPFAKQTVYAINYPDSDTITQDTGTNRAMMVAGQSLKSGTFIEPSEAGGYAGDSSGRASINNSVTCLFHLAKSSGKWQAEFAPRGRRDRSYVGLAPNDWTNSESTLLRPGYTSDSFSVRFATLTNGLGVGIVQSGDVQVGTIPENTQVVTLAADLDASPQTVRVVCDGVVTGTYNLPVTGKPWLIVIGGSAQGGGECFTQNLASPQSGFTNWAP